VRSASSVAFVGGVTGGTVAEGLGVVVDGVTGGVADTVRP
jgi:hypothetical protein